MYKSLLILSIYFVQITSFANSDQITKIFLKYESEKKAFLSLDLSKEHLQKNITAFLKNAEADLAAITDIESKMKDEYFSKEGTRIAYEIEMFQPLADFSKSKMKSSDCERYQHENSLNSSDNEDLPVVINTIIARICN